MTIQLRSLSSASLDYFTHIVYEHDGEALSIDARDAHRIDFENAAPVRTFPSWPGKRNYSGFYWAATNNRHIGFESLTEKTALMLLDRDPKVIGISSQPMWILWPKDSGHTAHAPDFFVRYDNGEGVVLDVRPEALVDERSAETFEQTRRNRPQQRSVRNERCGHPCKTESDHTDAQSPSITAPHRTNDTD
ncbi:TnsA-like heteromeric transposase endonuclease subunit [Luethyella okanaganae]|uniref:TnsA-like heteromeric transposase endonuclease subunit n=1 Tax=Luethyella okanaganae TaxID=69372 RepID=A0ABW1VIS6_9MICO